MKDSFEGAIAIISVGILFCLTVFGGLVLCFVLIGHTALIQIEQPRTVKNVGDNTFATYSAIRRVKGI